MVFSAINLHSVRGSSIVTVGYRSGTKKAAEKSGKSQESDLQVDIQNINVTGQYCNQQKFGVFGAIG